MKLRRFMARADAGVGAVEMAMVVARGARGGCGNGARDLWLQVRGGSLRRR